MENIISLSLVRYEQDFLSFQRELPKLRETKPNQFVAFKDNCLVSSGPTVEDIKEELTSRGIDPSGTVIEFVSEKEIKVIV